MRCLENVSFDGIGDGTYRSPGKAARQMSTTRVPLDIATTARRVFARVGLEAATLEMIATEAGVDVATLRERYGSTDALARDLIAEWIAQDRRLLTSDEGANTMADAVADGPPAPPLPPASPLADDAPPQPDAPAPVVSTLPPAHGGKVATENQTLRMDMSRLSALSAPPTLPAHGGAPLNEIFRSAMRSLNANRVRSLLTMLGIIIGVSSVVILLSVGNALTGYVSGLIGKGAPSVAIIEGADQYDASKAPTGAKSPSLTLDDIYALTEPGTLPDALALSAEVRSHGTATAAGVSAAVTLAGVSPTYARVQSYDVAAGDFLTEGDEAGEATVAVLGANVADTLFGDADPVGATVLLNSKSFRVVGVMTHQGVGGLDDQVYIPLTTALNRAFGARAFTANGLKVVDTISIKATSITTVRAAADEATRFLAARHDTPGTPANFTVTTALQGVDNALMVLKIIQLFLVLVAAISLLVGGVGIMNIMLVSVQERTREIGIRKAIGAKEGAILTQFLIESVFISLVGAALGVTIGGIGALLVNILWRPAPVPVPAVLVAVCAALMTGLVFGVSPARRAARLRPIEALRTE